MIDNGSRLCCAVLLQVDPEQREESGRQAVVAERAERVLDEVPLKEPNCQVGADAGHDAAQQHLRPDTVAERSYQVGDLEYAGGEDDRVASRNENRAASR